MIKIFFKKLRTTNTSCLIYYINTCKSGLLKHLIMFLGTHLHPLAIYIHGMHSEVYTNSVMMFVSELARLEAVDDARLPHIAVSNEDNFK